MAIRVTHSPIAAAMGLAAVAGMEKGRQRRFDENMKLREAYQAKRAEDRMQLGQQLQAAYNLTALQMRYSLEQQDVKERRQVAANALASERSKREQEAAVYEYEYGKNGWKRQLEERKGYADATLTSAQAAEHTETATGKRLQNEVDRETLLPSALMTLEEKKMHLENYGRELDAGNLKAAAEIRKTLAESDKIEAETANKKQETELNAAAAAQKQELERLQIEAAKVENAYNDYQKKLLVIQQSEEAASYAATGSGMFFTRQRDEARGTIDYLTKELAALEKGAVDPDTGAFYPNADPGIKQTIEDTRKALTEAMKQERAANTALVEGAANERATRVCVGGGRRPEKNEMLDAVRDAARARAKKVRDGMPGLGPDSTYWPLEAQEDYYLSGEQLDGTIKQAVDVMSSNDKDAGGYKVDYNDAHTAISTWMLEDPSVLSSGQQTPPSYTVEPGGPPQRSILGRVGQGALDYGLMMNPATGLYGAGKTAYDLWKSLR